jgi:hypothetical protein
LTKPATRSTNCELEVVLLYNALCYLLEQTMCLHACVSSLPWKTYGVAGCSYLRETIYGASIWAKLVGCSFLLVWIIADLGGLNFSPFIHTVILLGQHMPIGHLTKVQEYEIHRCILNIGCCSIHIRFRVPAI